MAEKNLLITRDALGSGKWVIATIALKGSGLITEVKQRQDVKLFEITKRNRNSLLWEILKEINPKNSHPLVPILQNRFATKDGGSDGGMDRG
jgi:hypothetical protein